jgi:hypothetical protein
VTREGDERPNSDERYSDEQSRDDDACRRRD